MTECLNITQLYEALASKRPLLFCPEYNQIVPASTFTHVILSSIERSAYRDAIEYDVRYTAYSATSTISDSRRLAQDGHGYGSELPVFMDLPTSEPVLPTTDKRYNRLISILKQR